jgi:hypothetical protein
MADDNDERLQKEEGIWSVFEDPNNYPPLGFLQMCIERRFHLAVQDRFMKETGLGETDYWIHTDAGGSPKMESEVHLVAPNYCYAAPQRARIMGWSAHGSKCGGFPTGATDWEILKALQETLNKKPGMYPGARHLGFFAKEGQTGNQIEILLIEPK